VNVLCERIIEVKIFFDNNSLYIMKVRTKEIKIQNKSIFAAQILIVKYETEKEK
jgi:hypothetical protein